jgi:hypothetical protein
LHGDGGLTAAIAWWRYQGKANASQALSMRRASSEAICFAIRVRAH